jgi:hypothetical protein
MHVDYTLDLNVVEEANAELIENDKLPPQLSSVVNLLGPITRHTKDGQHDIKRGGLGDHSAADAQTCRA